ncbi:YkyA family protein [Bacillus carboniphilus]|uniref:YkyA family protein n=1 Tax=Bacillus carboniphilus TaxID=86663 RepID=A0ABY9K070_9BACI|nr:YkyA family protein [Bacillus carboniphilus]WLR43291.1 YkyA family protein [Bacillus carboniphilus]
MKKRIYVVLLLCTTMLMSCANDDPAKEIYDIFEQVVAIEKGFQEEQEPRVELEKKENEIYNNLVELGNDQQEQIEELSDKALTNISKREEILQSEIDSIEESKEEFSKVEDKIDEIEEEDQTDQLQKTIDIMNQRYEVHDSLATHYREVLKLEEELYNLFKQEDAAIEEIDDVLQKINGKYKEIIEDNQLFNDYTQQYNEAKMNFYEMIDLQVIEEE